MTSLKRGIGVERTPGQPRETPTLLKVTRIGGSDLALAMCDGIIDNFWKLLVIFFLSISFENFSIIFGNISIISKNY